MDINRLREIKEQCERMGHGSSMNGVKMSELSEICEILMRISQSKSPCQIEKVSSQIKSENDSNLMSFINSELARIKDK